MKTVVLDIETISDQRAIARCNYSSAPDSFAPWPLHEVACASILSVERNGWSGLNFELKSFSRRKYGERGIVASVEREIENAHQIITYNGKAFDLPVLVTRALLAGEHTPKLARLRDRSRPSQHRDIHEEVKGTGPSIKLAHFCAAFAIPAKPIRDGRSVADLASDGQWLDIEHYCETDVVATWVATQMLDSSEEPTFGRDRWKELSRWIIDCAPANPYLSAFCNVPEPLISDLRHVIPAF